MAVRCLLVGLLLYSCGVPTYVVVTVDSELTIPDQVDALHIQITDAGGTRLLYGSADERIDLEAGTRFPIEVLFEPAEGSPEEIRIRVTAFLESNVVAETEALTDWREGGVTRVPPLVLKP